MGSTEAVVFPRVDFISPTDGGTEEKCGASQEESAGASPAGLKGDTLAGLAPSPEPRA